MAILIRVSAGPADQSDDGSDNQANQSNPSSDQRIQPSNTFTLENQDMTATSSYDRIFQQESTSSSYDRLFTPEQQEAEAILGSLDDDWDEQVMGDDIMSMSLAERMGAA